MKEDDTRKLLAVEMDLEEYKIRRGLKINYRQNRCQGFGVVWAPITIAGFNMAAEIILMETVRTRNRGEAQEIMEWCKSGLP